MKALGILKLFLNGYAPEDEDINEAIEEIKELENRSCINCKHYKQSSHQIYKTCFLIKTNGFNLESNVDFCCNKWEK